MDLIDRQAAIDAICDECLADCMPCEYFPCGEIKAVQALPSAKSDNGYSDGFCDGYKRGLTDAQPDNQINLCDSCDYSYPDCPSKDDDVIFGNGIGNDNICACNKYKPYAQPEPCEDAVSRQVAIDTLLKWMRPICINNTGEVVESDVMVAVRNILKTVPSVQPEREKGEWNRYYRTHSRDTFVCNKCGSCFVVLQGEDKMDFCPHCGADMRDKEGVQDD